MNKQLPIPKSAQFEALASGLRAVYSLLSEYLGDLNKVPDFRRHITVSRKELAAYMRMHPQLAERHVSLETSPKYHEFPVLEYSDGKYRVYEMYRGETRFLREFDDLAEAAAEYLMWGW